MATYGTSFDKFYEPEPGASVRMVGLGMPEQRPGLEREEEEVTPQ